MDPTAQPPFQTPLPPQPPASRPPLDWHLIAMLIGAFVVVLTLFIGGAYVFGIKQYDNIGSVPYELTPLNKPKPRSVNTKTNQQATPSAETANWRTYISAKGRFSLKYPENWPLVNVPLPNDTSAPLDDIVFSPNYRTNSTDTIIAFITASAERVQALSEYLKTLKQDSSIIDIQETTLAGESAVSYKRTGGIGALPIIEYVVFKNGTMYTLVLENSPETNKNREANITTFNKLLSTFKFTN